MIKALWATAALLASLAALFIGAWQALGWQLNPVHDRLTVLQQGQTKITAELAVVHNDLRDVVSYLRGQARSLPHVYLMDHAQLGGAPCPTSPPFDTETSRR